MLCGVASLRVRKKADPTKQFLVRRNIRDNCGEREGRAAHSVGVFVPEVAEKADWKQSG